MNYPTLKHLGLLAFRPRWVSVRDLLPVILADSFFQTLVFRQPIDDLAQLLKRFSIMRASAIDNGAVVAIVSYHDLVLRGLMQLIKES